MALAMIDLEHQCSPTSERPIWLAANGFGGSRDDVGCQIK